MSKSIEEELKAYGPTLVKSAREALGSDLVTQYGKLYAVRLTDELYDFLVLRGQQLEQLLEVSTGQNPGAITPSDMLALLTRQYKEEVSYVPE